MKTKNKKILLSVPRRMHILLKLENLGKRIIYLFTLQHQKLNRHRFIKVLFLASLVICLLFGQVGYAQTQNASVLVEQGIKDYDAGNFPNAVKHWQEALNQYKNNPSEAAVVN